MYEKHAAEIAARLANARAGLVENIARLGEITTAEAEKVYDHYRKSRIIKISVGLGRATVTHGAYLDRPVIRRALALCGKRYTVGGRRRLYTLDDARAVANAIASKTGVIVAIEEAR